MNKEKLFEIWWSTFQEVPPDDKRDWSKPQDESLNDLESVLIPMFKVKCKYAFFAGFVAGSEASKEAK